MITKPFKTFVFATFSGAVGGIISGGLLGALIGLFIIGGDIADGDWAALMALSVFAIYGAIFGLFGGLFAGFGAGVLLTALNKVAEARRIGLGLGSMIGAAMAALLMIEMLVPNLQLSLGVLIIYVGFAALLGAATGGLGGRTAGALLIGLLGNGHTTVVVKPHTA